MHLGALLQLFLHFGHAPVGWGIWQSVRNSAAGGGGLVLVVGFFASQGQLHPGVAILFATAAGRVGDNGRYRLSEKVTGPPSPSVAGFSYAPWSGCRGADKGPS
jgi:hypothetical protein